MNKIILEQFTYSIRLSDSNYVEREVPLHTFVKVPDTNRHSYDVLKHEIVMILGYNDNDDVVVHLWCNNTGVAQNIKFNGPFYIFYVNAENSHLDGTTALCWFNFAPYEGSAAEITWCKELYRNQFTYDTYIIRGNLYQMNFSEENIPDQPIEPSGINLEDKQITITENGVTTVVPTLMEGYDALSSVEITTDVPSDVNNADVNNDSLITTNGTFSIPSGYTGFNNFEVALPLEVNKTSVIEIPRQYYIDNVNQFGNLNYSGEIVPSTNYLAMEKNTLTFSLLSKTITTNGTYNIYENRAGGTQLGWWKVDVNVPQGEMIMNALPGDNGVVTVNGQYNIPSGSTGFDSFTVNVPQSAVNNADVNANSIITTNGTFSIPLGYTGFNNFEVAIPITGERFINYTIDDQNYPNTNISSTVNTLFAVPSGYQGQGNLTIPVKMLYKSITTNGSYSIVNNRSTNNELGFWKVDVNVPQPSIQNSKTVNITQNTIQPLVLTPDLGYDALRQIELNVNVPQTGVNSLVIGFIDSGLANHPVYDYMYTRNTSGSYIYLEPSQYAELWIQKSNGDVEFVVYYYNSTGSRYPLTNATACYYQISTPAIPPLSKPQTGDPVYLQYGVSDRSNQLIINWYEKYFSGTNMPGLYTASITFPSALIGNTVRLPFFDN